MQNNTSKMVTLLGKIRKQMNGAVLDTFRYYGAKYGTDRGSARIREICENADNFLNIESESAILIEQSTGQILFEKNSVVLEVNGYEFL